MQILLVAVFVMLAIMGLAYGVYLLTGGGTRTAGDRIAELIRGQAGPASEMRTSSEVNRFVEIIQPAARLAQTDDQEEMAALRKRLLQAGYRQKNAVELFSGIRVIAALLGGGIGFLLVANEQLLMMSLGALTGTAFGYYLPAILVTNSLQKRQAALLKAFPDALDLLVSCVEAGLALDAAFRRVSEEMEAVAPDLSRELQQVTYEVSAGIPRAEALRHLVDRTGMDEIRSLVNVLVQAERFGTSVARALRSHSDHLRTRRAQKAEEKAAQVSPKMTVIMILFILPTLMVILLGPALVRVRQTLAVNPPSSSQ